MMSSVHCLVVFAFLCIVTLTLCTEIEIWNRRLPVTWIGAHANKGFKVPEQGGWKVYQNKKVTIDLPDDWEGRFWPRTFCNLTDDERCETGGCGKSLYCQGQRPTPPATTIEFKLSSTEPDMYSISLVNGFNVIVTVSPNGIEGRNCKTVSCNYPFVKKCPKELTKEVETRLAACQSPCHVFKIDEYCCRGKFEGKAKCLPTKWPVNYTKMYKDKCPDVKTHLYDETNVWHSCKANKYTIIIEEANPRY